MAREGGFKNPDRKVVSVRVRPGLLFMITHTFTYGIITDAK